MNKPTCKTNCNGTKEWCLNRKRHREDGPAIERADGSKEWCLNWKYLTEEEFNTHRLMKKMKEVFA